MVFGERHLQVWFDADDGQRLLAELNLRCEAGWRYSAADQEEMGSWFTAGLDGIDGVGMCWDVLMLSYFFDFAIDFKMLGSPKVIPPSGQVQRKLEHLINI